MANFRSWHDNREAARRSAQIDRQIKRDGKTLGSRCRLLLFGTSVLSLRSSALTLGLGLRDSGKSTIVKRMRIAHQGCFSYDEKMAYREVIYSNLLESAQAVAAALREFQIEPADPFNVVSSRWTLGSSCRPSILFRVENVGTRVRVRSRCGVAVANVSISLRLPKPTCRGHIPSLARSDGARFCRLLPVTVRPDGQCSLVSVRSYTRWWAVSH